MRDTDALDLIADYLHGEIDRIGLEAIYYSMRLEQEVQRRSQAEAEAHLARQLLAEQIADSIREVRDLQQDNARQRRWARAWKRVAKAERNLANEMIQRASDLTAQLSTTGAKEPASVDEPEIISDLPALGACPYCGATGIDAAPWANARQRNGHLGSCPRGPRRVAKTERLPCPHCAGTYTQQGMGAHLKRAHGQAALDAYRIERDGPATVTWERPPALGDPRWRCAVCNRPSDVIAVSVGDPSRCVGCIGQRREAA